MAIHNSKEEQSKSENQDNVTSDEAKQIVNIGNPRSNLSAKKYQKSINWRRNKVRELLSKGYDQQEIVSILHVSQPTISRDIALLYNQQEKEIDDYGKLLIENHFDIVNGSTELLEKA